MATPRKKTTVKRSYQINIHEINPAGQHRIVSIKDGVSTAGEWVTHNQIAVLDGLRAATGAFAGVLPNGIFRATVVDTTVIG